MMSKLYIGNLPSEISEINIRKLFVEHGITPTNVLLKKGGYAFIDCTDQSSIDRAIEKLNGCTYQGHNLVVEPSVAGGGAKRFMLESRVRISGVPVDAADDELEQVLSSVGEVDKCEKYESRDGQTQVVHVSFASAETAKQAVQDLNGYNLAGSNIKVERLMDKKPGRLANGRNGHGNYGSRGMMGDGSPMQRSTEFPLRILVLSEMVGAIIGREGATIRTITQQTRARVDVHRKDNAGSLEKAITVYGNPENCTKACKRIMEVMKKEAEHTNKGSDIPLKILAHNNLIGRIIGKAGSTIKKTMEETNTRITVSSINDINSYNLERIITIKGSIDDISEAEAIISSKLRQSYENDLNMFSPPTSMFPSMNPMAMMSSLGYGMGRSSSGGPPGYGMSSSYPPMYPPMQYNGNSSPQLVNDETVYLYIPNSSVGAVIGTKGSHIRNMIRFSGATIKIASTDEGRAPEDQQERKVTIVGPAEAQWKAQFLLFDKIREEGYAVHLEEVRLTVEILIPSSQVGRIIGKGGQMVKDLQRNTGAQVKFPNQNTHEEEETVTHIIGTFYSVQSAQRRVRSILAAYRNKSPTPRN